MRGLGFELASGNVADRVGAGSGIVTSVAVGQTINVDTVEGTASVDVAKGDVDPTAEVCFAVSFGVDVRLGGVTGVSNASSKASRGSRSFR